MTLKSTFLCFPKKYGLLDTRIILLCPFITSRSSIVEGHSPEQLPSDAHINMLWGYRAIQISTFSLQKIYLQKEKDTIFYIIDALLPFFQDGWVDVGRWVAEHRASWPNLHELPTP